MINKILSKYFNKDSRELLFKSSTYLIIRILGTFFTFGFSYYVINNYSSSVYGLISLGFSFFLIISVVGRLGLDLNTVKHFSQKNYKDDIGLFYKALIVAFCTSGILSLLIFLNQNFIVYNIFEKPKPELVPYLNWILLSIPFWSVTLLSAHFLRSRKMNNWFVFFNNPGRFVVSIAVLLIFQYLYVDDSLLVVKSHFIAVVLLSILSTFLAFKNLEYIKLESKTKLTFFVKDSLPMMYSSTINMLINWVGIFILGIYSTSTDIAIFEIAVKISLLLTFISQALNSILAPKIAQYYYEQDFKNLQNLVTLSTSINFISCLLLTIIIIVFNKQITGVFGAEFQDSVFLLILLSFSQLIGAFCGSVGIILQMSGYQKVYRNFMFISLFILIVSMLLLVPSLGSIGAAISMLLSMIFWNVFGTVYVKKYLNINSYFRIPYNIFKKIDKS